MGNGGSSESSSGGNSYESCKNSCAREQMSQNFVCGSGAKSQSDISKCYSDGQDNYNECVSKCESSGGDGGADSNKGE